MVKDSLDKIEDEMKLYDAQINENKCTNCQRKIIEKMKTKNGCVWCDVEYNRKRNKNG